jgi:hypothetical protein
MALEPTTQAFINSLSGPPLSQLSPEAALSRHARRVERFRAS